MTVKLKEAIIFWKGNYASAKSKKKGKKIPDCGLMENIYLIYAGKDIIYCGRTIRDINTRLKEHLRDTETDKGKAIQKYINDGVDVYIKLYKVDTVEAAPYTESNLIHNLLNDNHPLLNTSFGIGKSNVPIVEY